MVAGSNARLSIAAGDSAVPAPADLQSSSGGSPRGRISDSSTLSQNGPKWKRTEITITETKLPIARRWVIPGSFSEGAQLVTLGPLVGSMLSARPVDLNVRDLHSQFGSEGLQGGAYPLTHTGAWK